MFCGNCGHALEPGAGFCPNCGAAVETNTTTSTNAAFTGGEASGAAQVPNVHLEKAKHISKGFFSFFMEHIKAPVRHGFTVDKANWLNGLITQIIFIVLAALSTAIVSNSFTSYFGVRVSFMDSFVKPLLYMAIVLAIIIGIIYLVAKMMKSDANILDVVARFGTFMLIPAAFMTAGFVFGVLRLYSLVGIMSLGYMLSLLIAVVLTVYSYGKDRAGGIDTYYAILIAYLGLGLAFYLFGESLLTRSFSPF